MSPTLDLHHTPQMPPDWREKKKLGQAARKAAAEASAKAASNGEEEAIITSYNQYVTAKGFGRQASIVGREWTAYKAKHADKVRKCAC